MYNKNEDLKAFIYKGVSEMIRIMSQKIGFSLI